MIEERVQIEAANGYHLGYEDFSAPAVQGSTPIPTLKKVEQEFEAGHILAVSKSKQNE